MQRKARRPKRCITSLSGGLSAGSFFAPRPVVHNLLSVWAIVINPLINYAWSDHNALMGTTEYAWQDVGNVLMHFSKRKTSARQSSFHATGIDFNGFNARLGNSLFWRKRSRRVPEQNTPERSDVAISVSFCAQ
ncbi:MAG: hypothetical protein WBN03_22695 [Desulfobacterales bacterium]